MTGGALASLRSFDAALRRPLRGRLDRLVASPRVPFEVRSRLLWRQQQGVWMARRPETFSEKVRWKMLKDRRPLLATFADKVAVRDYVARVAGRECLTECYAVVSDPEELDRDTLPREFVAKSSHGSGGVWIVSERAPEEGLVLPGDRPLSDPASSLTDWCWVLTTPDRLDWEQLVGSFRHWLTMNYGVDRIEWAYIHVPPRIIVEELLRTRDGRHASEWKLFVFHGRVRLLYVDVDRYVDHRRNFYLRDWTPLEIRKDRYPPGEVCPPPEALGRMLEVAEALGQETDFVRVDLYDVDGRVVVGELTNYPSGGIANFSPTSYDAVLGRSWTLPRRYG
jgi:hypothetical protein